MAITNAQQFKQLVNPPMDNKRPGYRGDAAARSTGAAQSGRADPGERGDPGEGANRAGFSAPTRGESAFTSPDRFVNVNSQAIERARKFKASQDAQRDSGNFFTNLLNPRAKRRAMFNASLFLPGSKANITKKRKAYADYLKSLGITPTDELLDTDNLYDFFDKQAFEKGKTINTGVGIDELNQKIYDKLAEDMGPFSNDPLRNQFETLTQKEFMSQNPDLF